MSTRGQKRTPEQRANISRGTSRGMEARAPEAKEEWRQRLRDAHLCRVHTPRGRPNLRKGHTVRVSKEAIARRVATQRAHTVLRRAVEHIGIEHIDEIVQAILDGLHAPPPRSYPYITFLMDRVLGKPTENGNLVTGDSSLRSWIEYLTEEQLAMIATWIAEAKARAALDEQQGKTTAAPLVIDAVGVREPEEVER